MKIYEVEPVHLVRICINKKDEQPKYINLIETTAPEVVDMCIKLIEAQHLSIFCKGHMTRIDIREALGAKNGKSKSVSFKGLTVQETFNIIVNHVKQQQQLNEDSNTKTKSKKYEKYG
jgi:hypothetical protein